jgi:hypothetical protein
MASLHTQNGFGFLETFFPFITNLFPLPIVDPEPGIKKSQALPIPRRFSPSPMRRYPLLPFCKDQGKCYAVLTKRQEREKDFLSEGEKILGGKDI